MFLGWSTSNTATSVTSGYEAATMSAGKTYTGNANLSLYTVWKKKHNKPVISNLSIVRCLQDGTTSDDVTATYGKIQFDWQLDPNNSNGNFTWQVFYRESGSTGQFTQDSDAKTVTSSNKNGTVSYTMLSKNTYATTTSYEIKLVVTETGTASGTEAESGEATGTLAQAFTALVISSTPYHSVGIGKTPTAAETLDIGLNIALNTTAATSLLNALGLGTSPSFTNYYCSRWNRCNNSC